MAVVQPAPAASAPQPAASAPLSAASAPNTAAVAFPANTQTIAVTLQPEAKKTSWLDPTVLTPAVAFLVFLFSIWSTRKNLQLAVANTEKQLTAASTNLEKQLAAAAASTDRQLAAAAATTEKQLKAAQDGADAKMAHDREEARIDRLMEARRDIYVEIMADYQKVQQFIGGLANADAKFEERALLSAMSASVNKLWIWGEVESALKIREFYTQVHEFYYAALARAMTIKKTRDYIVALGTLQSDAETRVKQAEEQLRVLRMSPEYVHGLAKSRRLEVQLSGEQKQANDEAREYRGHITDYSRALNRKEYEYLDFIIDRQTELNSQINAVMAAARADIGIGGDVSGLNTQTEAMSKRVRDAIENYRSSHQKDMESVFGSDYEE